MVRFMRSTCPFVQGCRGLVRRCATSFWAQANSNAWARKSCLRASIALISSGVQVLPLGSVKQVELALLGPQLGEVDLEEADGIALERGPPRLVALCVGQPRDAVALQAPVQ